jgi:hypothetical protein
MKRTIAAGVLAAGIVAGSTAALVAPTIAIAADASTAKAGSATDRAAARLGALKDALKGLVSDGTITQAQANKVATTLSTADIPFGGGHRGRFGVLSPDATATVLGITPEQLRDARDSGRTLAQIAATKGISRADLISKLVAAAKTQLAADLKAGRLTQAQYDSAVSGLTTHIAEHVDQVGRPHHGPGPGPGAAAPSSTAGTPRATT